MYNLNLFFLLTDKKFHTASELSKKLKISEKTVRKKVKEYNDILKHKNLKIISKARYGFKLEGELENENIILENFNIPITPDERNDYLISLLLNTDDYLKLDDISEKIFVSPKTLSLNLKNVKKFFSKFNINIEKKPHYGFKIISDEINIRNAYIQYYEDKLNNNKFIKFSDKENIDKIVHITKIFFKDNNIKCSDVYFQRFIISVFVTLLRIEKNKKIENLNINNLFISKKKLDFYKKIIKLYFEKIGKNIDDNEINYILTHFITLENKSYIFNSKNREVYFLIKDIIYYINITFKINISNEKNLLDTLYNHIFSLLIRAKYNLFQKNPLLEDIKNKMFLEYNISLLICNLISKRIQRKIPEDEVGYISLILGISNVIGNHSKKGKKNILIVCPIGRGMSKFMVHNYEKLFSKYCNYINSCSERELEELNLEFFDVIFTVTNLKLKLNIPVYKINPLLNDNDINFIKNILKNNQFNYEDIFHKELFEIIKGNQNKNEIIKNASNKIKNKFLSKKNIEKLIHEREKLGMTEFGEKVAIPHPIKSFKNMNGLGISISKSGVLWSKNKINIIIFLLLNEEQQKNEKIYMILNKIIENEKIQNKIINVKNYNQFIEILKEIGDDKYAL